MRPSAPVSCWPEGKSNQIRAELPAVSVITAGPVLRSLVTGEVTWSTIGALTPGAKEMVMAAVAVSKLSTVRLCRAPAAPRVKTKPSLRTPRMLRGAE